MSETIGELLNPEIEQDIEDQSTFGENFMRLNPDNIQGVNIPQADTTYRSVVVEERKVLLERRRRLD